MSLKNAILQTLSSAKHLDELVPALEKHMADHDMTTPARQAMFIAQCLHESAGFRYMREIWGPTKWQDKYEGHVGLGNTQTGDGKKFMGRGLIQLTGRKNYQAFADWCGRPEIMDTPELVEQPDLAVLSAIWYWSKNDLNRFADANDIQGCTRAVNGKAMLGLEERTKYYNTLLNALQS